jgi:hypothetical protein
MTAILYFAIRFLQFLNAGRDVSGAVRPSQPLNVGHRSHALEQSANTDHISAQNASIGPVFFDDPTRRAHNKFTADAFEAGQIRRRNTVRYLGFRSLPRMVETVIEVAIYCPEPPVLLAALVMWISSIPNDLAPRACDQSGGRPGLGEC